MNRMMLREFGRSFLSDYIARVSGPLAFLLFILSLIFQSQRLASLIGAVTCVVLSAYRLWANEHRRLLASEERRFEVLFESAPSACVQTGPPEPPEYCLYRIGVKNLSQRTVDHVGLDVVRLEPISITCLPLHLQVMHHPGSAEGGPLDPGQIRYFDFVHQMVDATVHIAHVIPSAPNQLPSQRTVVSVEAHGRDAKAERRSFVLDFTGERLVVSPEDP